jgi:hypothetical protein
LRAQLLTDLAQQCDVCVSPVKSEAAHELRQLVDESNVAKAAAALASTEFRASYPLPGTGGEEWAALFEAARTFAAVAYSNARFPALSANDPCPLCQQPLGEQTARLLAFDQFVQRETEKTFKEKHAAATAAFRKLYTASFALKCAETTRAEVIALDAGLMETIDKLPTLAEDRRDLIKKACAKDITWAEVTELPASPTIRLTELARESSTEAEALEKMADEKAAAAARAAFDELDMRIKLGTLKSAVLDAVAVAQRAERLRLCEQDLRSNVITLKVGELNEKIVTPALAGARNQKKGELPRQTDTGKSIIEARVGDRRRIVDTDTVEQKIQREQRDYAPCAGDVEDDLRELHWRSTTLVVVCFFPR